MPWPHPFFILSSTSDKIPDVVICTPTVPEKTNYKWTICDWTRPNCVWLAGFWKSARQCFKKRTTQMCSFRTISADEGFACVRVCVNSLAECSRSTARNAENETRPAHEIHRRHQLFTGSLKNNTHAAKHNENNTPCHVDKTERG